MQIITLALGSLEENCYIIFDEGTKDAIIVDPGDDGVRIEDKIRDNGLKVKYIVNTHGHYDHVGADSYIALSTGAPVLIHPNDEVLARHSVGNYDPAGTAESHEIVFEPLMDGQELEVGNTKFKVMHTPGHTEGCICLYTPGHLITGDLLFQGSIGRTDLPGGSFQQMHASLKRVVSLPGDTCIYPGHYGQTTVAQEKQINPYVAELDTL